MEAMMKKDTSHWWWFDSHNSSKKSPWLHSTLTDLENKTKGMLKLIEQDADSFAQRAEMYYQKRPELISMVEDFYRMHRSLAENYDLLKSDVGNRMVTSLGSPFSTRSQSDKLSGVIDRNFDSQSETYDHEDCAESEVDDPEHEDEAQIDEDMGEEVNEPEEKTEQQVDENAREVQSASPDIEDEMARLREELESLKEENMCQKNQLLQKDEEKREVIRQLTLAMEVLKLENVSLRKVAARESPKKRSRFEFIGKFLNRCSES